MKADEIDKILRDKLARYEMLPQEIPPLQMPVRSLSFTGRYMATAVVVAACFVAGLVLNLLYDGDTFTPKIITTETVAVAPEVTAVECKVNEQHSVAVQSLRKGKRKAEIINEDVAQREVVAIEKSRIEDFAVEKSEVKEDVVPEVEVIRDRDYYKQYEEELVVTPSKKRRLFALRGYTSLSAGSSSPNVNSMMAEMRLNSGYGAVFSVATNKTDIYTSEILPMRASFIHKMPVSVGVSVDYQLSKRLSLSSGLSFTYLESEIKQPSVSFSTYKQEVYYLGIPLGVSCKFVGGSLFDLYVIGGIQAEYAVSINGLSEREGALGTSRSAVSLDCNRFQFSVNAAIGAALKLSPTISLYAEPGVSYYFTNHNKPITYRTEKPLQFSLRTGLRITL